MSQMTNFMENALADMARGQGITLPTDWHLALGSAAADGSFTELTGTDYGRQAVTRSLANFAGTQSAGSTTASTGTSHTTSNNTAVDYGFAGSAWGTANVVGFFDLSTGGNCWMWADLPAPLVIDTSDPVEIPIGNIVLTLGIVGGMSDYLANALIDLVWRAQSYTWPASLYGSLFTAAPSNAGGGTEVSAVSYARPSIASSSSAWSATNGAGTTTVPSSGTAGRISNNATLAYAAPGAYDWGTITHEGLKDAATVGNLMFWGALANPKTVAAGGTAPSHAANTMGISFA